LRPEIWVELMKNKPIATALTSEIDVGRHLRTLRVEQKLSIRALAETSGLNVNTLSLIEHGKTSPSVSTLQQIALALKVPITTFFETEQTKTDVIFQKAGKRLKGKFAHGTLENLGVGFVRNDMEPFVVTLESGSGSGNASIVHTGLEFVFCLEGHIQYKIEDQTYLLEPGDSLLFEARLPHHWQNADKTPSRSLLVLSPSDESDKPTDVHFLK
jgi:transcriptional regulator with XRE-family HTH domain